MHEGEEVMSRLSACALKHGKGLDFTLLFLYQGPDRVSASPFLALKLYGELMGLQQVLLWTGRGRGVVIHPPGLGCCLGSFCQRGSSLLAEPSDLPGLHPLARTQRAQPSVLTCYHIKVILAWTARLLGSVCLAEEAGHRAVRG